MNLFFALTQWALLVVLRVVLILIGYKIKPSHQGSTEPAKGMTFKLNPWKAI